MYEPRTRASMLACSVAALALLLHAKSAPAQDTVGNDFARACGTLAAVDFSNIEDAPTVITSTRMVPATARTAAYCKVEGQVSPHIGFELQLPAGTWNRKVLEVGCAGWCGFITTSACRGPLKKGYACIASDMGHKGTMTDGSWARGNLQGLVDFGYRATHVTVLTGKAIAAKFYAQVPERAYFIGCSTGGYQGVTSAQRFPWDFDGIVAGAPDIDGGAASLRYAWILKVLLDDSGRPRLTPEDLRLVHEMALARCDLDDGVKDGVIGNPRACRVDARELACHDGNTRQCLSSEKAEIVNRVYAGPTTSAGEALSTGGFLPGSELNWISLWPAQALDQFFHDDIPGYSLPPSWRYRDFDFDHDYKRLGLAAYYENSNPDLRKFKKSGAKLIVYHGGNDTINLPGAATDYYDMVERAMGGRQSTQDFFRLFLIPGMNHCGGGDGAYTVDWLSVLEAWVERGRAPDRVVGARISEQYLLGAAQADIPIPVSSGAPPAARAALATTFLQFPLPADVPVSFSRPLFPYPAYARYVGTGDSSDAANFQPVQQWGLRAGAAKVDITPTLNAKAATASSTVLPVMSIRDRLHVRAIYFENGATCGVLIGVEQGAMRGTEPAVEQAARAAGCPRENVIASATHTHSGGTKNAAGDTPPDNEPNDATINAAIVKAVAEAKKAVKPARVGYGTTEVNLNINKELFAHDKWYQGADPAGPSDKTLAVLGFIAADGEPIGVYMNYAAHPIHYYLTGILSADFPGDASSYIERRYDDKTVAIFSQGASGDQNARYTVPFLQLAGARRGNVDRADDRIGQPEPWYKGSLALNENADAVKAMSRPMPTQASATYAKAKAFNDELVHAYGVLIGEGAIDALKHSEVNWQEAPTIAGSVDRVSCPGRDRIDFSARQGVRPPYKDGDPVELQVAALRIGDIDLVTVNGEVYNEIATHLKRVSPAAKTMMVTIASGPPARSGYIYSNAASDHLTFEVIGSRLKPGCAEDAIVASGVGQIRALSAAGGN